MNGVKARLRVLNRKGITYKVFYTALGMSQAHFSMCLNNVKRATGSPHHHEFSPEQWQRIEYIVKLYEAALKLAESKTAF